MHNSVFDCLVTHHRGKITQKETFSHVLENGMLQGWNGNINCCNLLCSKFIYIFCHFIKIIWELVRQFIKAYITEIPKNLCIKCIVYNFNCQSCFKARSTATNSAWNRLHPVLVAHTHTQTHTRLLVLVYPTTSIPM